MDINLTGQTAKADAIRPYLIQWKTELEKRYAIWERLQPEMRLKWIQIADTKDPLFGLFIDIVKYSRKWSVEDE